MPRNPRLRRKKLSTREVRIVFVIAVEGKTEKAYFEYFQGFVSAVQVIVNKGKASNPKSVLNQAESMLEKLKRADDLRPGDQAWVVVDRDQWNEEDIVTMWDWAAKRKDRGVALSLPQFEWWLLLHFEEGTGAGTQQEILNRLKIHIPNYEKGEKVQLPHTDKQHTLAIDNARRKIRENPEEFKELEDISGAWTTVHFLMEKIIEAIRASGR